MLNINIAIQDVHGPIASGFGYEMRLLPLAELLPTEHCNTQRAESLARKILADGAWTVPLLVEATDKIVMDGHHRLEAARELGLSHVPCLLLSYDRQDVSVVTWDGGAPFPPSDIIAAGRSGQLLPYKTTRHTLSRPIPSVTYKLNELQ
jgi:ParB-like chromosome segregation protein Spo0J